jgi:hypothetical protein
VAVFTAEMVKLLDAPSEARMPSKLGLRVGRVINRAAPVIGAPLEDGLLRLVKKRMKPVKRRIGRLVKALVPAPVRRRIRRAPKTARSYVRAIRHFFLVWLRAGIRVRVQRLLARLKAGEGRRAPAVKGKRRA